jgi:hypothetical protein
MRQLSNCSIEPARKVFKVAFIAFGTVDRPALERVVTVLASTPKGAKRIVRARYRRSSSHRVIDEAPLDSGLELS